jgi:hypothetical protein
MIKLFVLDIRLLKLVHLPQAKKCNKKYFINELLEEIHEECKHWAGCRITKAMKIHMDNDEYTAPWKPWQKYENEDEKTGSSTQFT